MSNWYVDRDRVKDACGIAVSATGEHDQIDMSIETVSRLIDDWIGYHVYPQEATRYYGARESGCLRLPDPLLAITALRTDAGGDGSYESTWTDTSYYLKPYNATSQSPPQPFWEIEVRQNSTIVFPSGVKRGVELAGRFGLYDERDTSTAVLSTTGGGLNATQRDLTITGASSLHVGNTILVDNEQMFVQDVSASGAGVGGGVTVDRAQNGTTGATHTTGAAIQIYRYPLVERAALYQAQNALRQGFADPSPGGGAFGQQAALNADVDLHPAVRRMLRGLRTPVVG